MISNGDREGLIFLSHPRRNYGFLFLLTILYHFFIFYDEVRQTCDMVTSFFVTDRRAAVRFSYLSHGVVQDMQYRIFSYG